MMVRIVATIAETPAKMVTRLANLDPVPLPLPSLCWPYILAPLIVQVEEGIQCVLSKQKPTSRLEFVSTRKLSCFHG